MKDEAPLPLARIVSINKPSFWIFLAACFVLYVYEWQYNYDRVTAQMVILNHMLIICTIFIGLLLNVIAAGIKNKEGVRNLIICTYFFEIASVLVGV